MSELGCPTFDTLQLLCLTGLSEWQCFLDISLSQPEDKSVEPPDPFMVLNYSETVADNIALLLAQQGKQRPGEIMDSDVFCIWRASSNFL